MSDSETPHDHNERDSAGVPPAPGPAGEAPEPSGPGAPIERPAIQIARAQLAEDKSLHGESAPAVDTELAEPSGGASRRLARFGRAARTRGAAWAALALLCVVAGTVASILGAHALARHDANKQSAAFGQNAAAVASAAKLALQREEELAVSAATFFAGNAKASPAQFARWVRWARTLRRFPELENLSLIEIVRKGQLGAFEARVTGRALKPATPGAAPAIAEAFPVVPASDHHYYCLATAELVRAAALARPAGQDYCALSPALLSDRDKGLSRYTVVSTGGRRALAIVTPVYRGNATPHTAFGRTAASVGWLREVLVPGVFMQAVLEGHPGIATRLSYRTGASRLTFANGTPSAGARSATTSLDNGWSVTSFAVPIPAGVFSNGETTALLAGGIVLSLLIGLLVFVLGAGRDAAPVSQEAAPQPPHDELYDALTGLPNRPLMLDRAEIMLARAGRQSGLLVGALFIDIDWFKDVNEKLGEAAGDQLLKSVAERLENVVRAGDTVGRLGDDEFVILVESAARGARLDALARRVIESLHRPFELEDFGPSFFMTASIGLAFGRYASPDDLLRDAQLALYAAKAAGKDRYTLFNANMRSVIEGRGVLEVELNAALAEKQFSLLYQPIYDLTSGAVAGLEARISWQHPKKGDVAPADFIPLAEETGLIVPIGRWVLEEACTRAAAWNVAGHAVGVSVEVSSNQLNREGFATDLRRALQQSGIEPSLLTLEVPETTVMTDLDAAVARLEEIKRLGVLVAIDDFGGSGYAYHSDLRRLPLDFLKVDRGSLAASDDEDYRTWLLEAILIVGRDLSLTVIAKGIETFEQLTNLETMGCTMAQGLFMGKPTPGDSVESLFEVALPTPRATGTRS
ncbi:MAG: bifunctional diguanylate cyclase/phosphodiesterase [Solirubrobacteraceae bacterium]